MKKFSKVLLLMLSALLALTAFTACGNVGDTLESLGELADIVADSLEDTNIDPTVSDPSDELPVEEESEKIAEDGSYTSKEDVALYIHTYGKLPQNFITKDEARSLGWEGGGLEEYAPGKCIGGDFFGNYEGLLPKRTGEPTLSAISTLSARIHAVRNGQFFPMTGLFISPMTTTRVLNCCTARSRI